MTLKHWIEKTGPKECAKLLKVDPATVSYWKLGSSLPRPHHMVKIYRLTNGRVTYKEMVERAAKFSK